MEGMQKDQVDDDLGASLSLVTFDEPGEQGAVDDHQRAARNHVMLDEHGEMYAPCQYVLDFL